GGTTAPFTLALRIKQGLRCGQLRLIFFSLIFLEHAFRQRSRARQPQSIYVLCMALLSAVPRSLVKSRGCNSYSRGAFPTEGPGVIFAVGLGGQIGNSGRRQR